MTCELGLPELTIGVLLFAALQFLAALWLSERFKAGLQRENNILLEKMRWEFKIREQASKVAGYMARARALREEGTPEEYEKANTLSWELALWLPAETYRSLGKAISKPDEKTNPLSVVVEVRKILLGAAAGGLTSNDIIHHAPGIGKTAS